MERNRLIDEIQTIFNGLCVHVEKDFTYDSLMRSFLETRDKLNKFSQDIARANDSLHGEWRAILDEAEDIND